MRVETLNLWKRHSRPSDVVRSSKCIKIALAHDDTDGCDIVQAGYLVESQDTYHNPFSWFCGKSIRFYQKISSFMSEDDPIRHSSHRHSHSSHPEEVKEQDRELKLHS
mmetsp:Transcript_1194/g.1745  ORF Transcript_1194/g.1745 Transcript_1194/m.1745 type:complete len:108 (+) Transcript_1194:222-545(+)